ncbi:Nramp family divalent metal transporter [Chitinophaga niabensis]|uniref:Mn2+ and Fe2+ transporters of the NRAMP family n=1 Tax=Chitinophaga niabensis TaxID=536979 RepID=A0A1N6H1H4_9BACT|nr:Nramp family divalent metal transporter [Chitinophaga niabensis]SIO13630.1 Mn2+ and Fe2+ transporters of the NRAMP family [Chitinophaga niabensis]
MADQKQSNVLSWLKGLGPGLIIAALVFGPSKMTITSKLGANYGFDLLWIIAVAIFFMVIFTNMAARIGYATQQSLLSSIKARWGKGVGIIIGIGVFLVCTSFQAGNSVGVGVALAELTHTSTTPWIIAFNIISIALLFFRAFYKVLEWLMIALIGLMLLSFIVTVFLVNPDLKQTAAGFIPSVSEGSQGLVIAFMASCFSIVGAFYQSYLVQERRRIRQLQPNQPEPKRRSDSVTGIIILGFMSAIVLICAAAILHPRNITVNTASDMSLALEPLFGSYASGLFLIGLFGASFSSIIGNAGVGGLLLGDALGYGNNFSAKSIRFFIALVMLAGAIIAIAFGRLPLELIVFAQSVTIFVVPVVGIAMYLIANDEKLMGKDKNSTFVKVAGALGLLVILALAVINFKDIFLK